MRAHYSTTPRASSLHSFAMSRRTFFTSLSYAEPQPIKPRDEADELRRQVLEMGKQLQAALGRIEALDRPALRSAA